MKYLLSAVLVLLLASSADARSCGGRRTSAAAQGCYTGSGNDNRKIPTGVMQPGLLLIHNVDVSAAQPGVYRIAEGGAGDSSCTIGNNGASTCGLSNEIQVLAPDYFEIGTGARVNTNGDPYCWQEWATGPNHATFVYTGDGSGSDRTITLATAATPAAALVQLDGTAACFGSGNFYMRTNDMPSNVSFGLYNVGEAPRTNVLRNLTAGGLVVGPCANELGKVYRGAWWVAAPGYGQAVTWLGNGDSGFSCADAGDQQAISVGGSVKSVITVGCQGNVSGCGSEGLACTSAGHTGVAPLLRGINMGPSIVGPGHTTDDFFGIFFTGSLFDDVIGNLTSGSFTVAGDGSFAQNLNDVGLRAYAWVTFANAPVIGTSEPDDWCFNANTVACYRSDIDPPGGVIVDDPLAGNNNCSSSSLSGGTTICGFPGCDCDLAGTATADSTNRAIGERSIAFDKSAGQYVSCDMATDCNEFDLGQGGDSLTWMGFFRVTADEDAIFISKSGSSSQQFVAGRAASGDSFYCGVKNTSGTAITDDGPSTFTVGDWHFGACVFDNAGNTLQAYFDGAFSGSPTAITTDLQGGNGIFGLGFDGAAASLNGNVNMVALTKVAASSTELCRACSLGWSGAGGQCFDADTTVYVDEGLNDTLCGGCTLPACDAAGP